MTIQDTHTYLDFMLDKTQSGFISPEEKDMALHRAQMAVFDIFYSEVVENQFVHTALNPFKKSVIRDATATPLGVVTLPSDYLYATRITRNAYNNVTRLTSYRDVKVYKQDEINDALNSQVRPVTVDYPIVEETGGFSLQLYPKLPNTVQINYVSLPDKCRFNYTQVGRVITYNPTGSVNLLWADTYCNIIMNKALETLGVNLNDPALVQYTQGKTMASLNSKDKL